MAAPALTLRWPFWVDGQLYRSPLQKSTARTLLARLPNVTHRMCLATFDPDLADRVRRLDQDELVDLLHTNRFALLMNKP